MVTLRRGIEVMDGRTNNWRESREKERRRRRASELSRTLPRFFFTQLKPCSKRGECTQSHSTVLSAARRSIFRVTIKCFSVSSLVLLFEEFIVASGVAISSFQSWEAAGRKRIN